MDGSRFPPAGCRPLSRLRVSSLLSRRRQPRRCARCFLSRLRTFPCLRLPRLPVEVAEKVDVWLDLEKKVVELRPLESDGMLSVLRNDPRGEDNPPAPLRLGLQSGEVYQGAVSHLLPLLSEDEGIVHAHRLCRLPQLLLSSLAPPHVVKVSGGGGMDHLSHRLQAAHLRGVPGIPYRELVAGVHH